MKLVILIVVIVAIYFIKQKPTKVIKNDQLLIEKFNNYTLLYMLHLIHRHLNENNIHFLFNYNMNDFIIFQVLSPHFFYIIYLIYAKSSNFFIYLTISSFKYC